MLAIQKEMDRGFHYSCNVDISWFRLEQLEICCYRCGQSFNLIRLLFDSMLHATNGKFLLFRHNFPFSHANTAIRLPTIQCEMCKKILLVAATGSNHMLAWQFVQEFFVGFSFVSSRQVLIRFRSKLQIPNRFEMEKFGLNETQFLRIYSNTTSIYFIIIRNNFKFGIRMTFCFLVQ